MDEAIEKSAMRKVYMRMLPFAILSYFLAYIDRINVSFAGLTMRGDLDMSATAFGFALGTFYWGYFIFEVPSNLIMEKVGARLWIARIMRQPTDIHVAGIAQGLDDLRDKEQHPQASGDDAEIVQGQQQHLRIKHCLPQAEGPQGILGPPLACQPRSEPGLLCRREKPCLLRPVGQ